MKECKRSHAKNRQHRPLGPLQVQLITKLALATVLVLGCAGGGGERAEQESDDGGCLDADDDECEPVDEEVWNAAGNPAKGYTGSSTWKAGSGTLVFTGSGNLPNGDGGWLVPEDVKKVIINGGVRVTGRFIVKHSMVFRGRDRNTSEIYGTTKRGYMESRGGCNGHCYPAILATGNITVKIVNLTSRNPYGFHFVGEWGESGDVEGLGYAKLLLDRVSAYDDRGGAGNNSDGIQAGAGSVVRNSYFETGDDVIKLYQDIRVENTEIKMIENTVPIQLGWGTYTYSDGAVGSFKGLRVTGNGGRGAANNALINAEAGVYDKEIEIDGLVFKNPNASLFSSGSAIGVAEVEVADALIDIDEVQDDAGTMTLALKLCGVSYGDGGGAPSQFDCD